MLCATDSLVKYPAPPQINYQLNAPLLANTYSYYWTNKDLRTFGLTLLTFCSPVTFDRSYPILVVILDRLCGLVYGYRYRGPGFDPRRYQIFWVVVGLERGPLSLVSLVRSIEELLEWKK